MTASENKWQHDDSNHIACSDKIGENDSEDFGEHKVLQDSRIAENSRLSNS